LLLVGHIFDFLLLIFDFLTYLCVPNKKFFIEWLWEFCLDGGTLSPKK